MSFSPFTTYISNRENGFTGQIKNWERLVAWRKRFNIYQLDKRRIDFLRTPVWQADRLIYEVRAHASTISRRTTRAFLSFSPYIPFVMITRLKSPENATIANLNKCILIHNPFCWYILRFVVCLLLMHYFSASVHFVRCNLKMDVYALINTIWTAGLSALHSLLVQNKFHKVPFITLLPK